MKLTEDMIKAGTHRGMFQLYVYDYEGLYEPVRKVAEKCQDEFGWDCWSDEKHAASFALDVIEECVLAGLLELPSGPTDTTPSPEEVVRKVLERHDRMAAEEGE